MADASTFRDFFLTIFFVSVGAFVDVAFFLSNAVPLLAGAAVIILIKAAVLTLAGRWSHVPLRGALLSGIALSGIGEFAVVVAGKAAESGLLSPLVTQTLLIEVVLTLGLSPLIMRAAIPLTRSWESARSGKAIKPESGKHFSKRMREIHDHAILCGYGTVGRMVHEALERLEIPVVIVELNAQTARRLIKEGHSVLFADISQADTMELAGVDRARVMVITFPHVGLARTAITIARERNPKLVTLCRARFPSEVEELRAVVPMGIVHDEREAGLEMLRLCLTAYDRDAAEIELATSDLIITEEEQEPPTESVPSLGT